MEGEDEAVQLGAVWYIGNVTKDAARKTDEGDEGVLGFGEEGRKW